MPVLRNVLVLLALVLAAAQAVVVSALAPGFQLMGEVADASDYRDGALAAWGGAATIAVGGLLAWLGLRLSAWLLLPVAAATGLLVALGVDFQREAAAMPDPVVPADWSQLALPVLLPLGWPWLTVVLAGLVTSVARLRGPSSPAPR